MNRRVLPRMFIGILLLALVATSVAAFSWSHFLGSIFGTTNAVGNAPITPPDPDTDPACGGYGQIACYGSGTYACGGQCDSGLIRDAAGYCYGGLSQCGITDKPTCTSWASVNGNPAPYNSITCDPCNTDYRVHNNTCIPSSYLTDVNNCGGTGWKCQVTCYQTEGTVCVNAECQYSCWAGDLNGQCVTDVSCVNINSPSTCNVTGFKAAGTSCSKTGVSVGQCNGAGVCIPACGGQDEPACLNGAPNQISCSATCNAGLNRCADGQCRTTCTAGEENQTRDSVYGCNACKNLDSARYNGGGTESGYVNGAGTDWTAVQVDPTTQNICCTANTCAGWIRGNHSNGDMCYPKGIIQSSIDPNSRKTNHWLCGDSTTAAGTQATFYSCNVTKVGQTFSDASGAQYCCNINPVWTNTSTTENQYIFTSGACAPANPCTGQPNGATCPGGFCSSGVCTPCSGQICNNICITQSRAGTPCTSDNNVCTTDVYTDYCGTQCTHDPISCTTPPASTCYNTTYRNASSSTTGTCFNPGGCSYASTLVACGSGQICSNGACIASQCPTPCAVGSRICTNATGYQICAQNASGCYVYTTPQSCPAGQGCTSGSCVPSCINNDGVCSPGCTSTNDNDCPVACIDNDHDGYNATSTNPACGTADCNDANASIRPGAVEVCNTVDDNCNGQIDENNVCNQCINNTGICGAGCTPANDNDCRTPLCTDSDGGINGTIMGRVVVNYTNASSDIFQDMCFGATQVTEYYCNGTRANQTTLNCQYGCLNGACVTTPPPQCDDNIDNDGDGKIDFPLDPGCASLTDNNESDNSDNDGDGCFDAVDAFPTLYSPDSDGDGIHDDCDNCINTSNPGQEDSDHDGIGDACDIMCPSLPLCAGGYHLIVFPSMNGSACQTGYCVQNAVCGDGIIQTGEQCDGSQWGPITACSNFDRFTGGTLRCDAATCQFNTSLCTGPTGGSCGDGIIQVGEQCDGNNWSPISGCSNFDTFTTGTLSCTSRCQFNTSQCIGTPPICTNTATGITVNDRTMQNSCIITNLSYNPASRFSDVPADFVFEPYITLARGMGITNGYPDNTFKPDNAATRGEIAAFIYRGFQVPQNTSNGPHFSDVAPTNAFYVPVESLKNAGFVNGFPDGTYRPNENMTRGLYVALIVKVMGLNTSNPPATPTFTDVLPTHPYYAQIEAAYSAGLVTGFGGGIFQPDANVTRSQAVIIIMRAVSPMVQNCTGISCHVSDLTCGGNSFNITLQQCNSCNGGVCAPSPAFCGDGRVDAGEECDGTNLGRVENCTGLDAFSGGSLSCTSSCLFNTTRCSIRAPGCGDGIVQPGEQCDGTNWGNISACADFDSYTGGTLSCNPNTCLFNVSSCTGGNTTNVSCGNGLIDAGEQCDGSSFGPIRGCREFDNFTGGALSCTSSCIINTSACIPPLSGVCGNGIIEPGESCDGNYWGPIDSCLDLGGFSGGSLSCNPITCHFNTTACTVTPVCGNGIVEAGERCDLGDDNGRCPSHCSNSCTPNSCGGGGGGGGGYVPPTDGNARGDCTKGYHKVNSTCVPDKVTPPKNETKPAPEPPPELRTSFDTTFSVRPYQVTEFEVTVTGDGKEGTEGVVVDLHVPGDWQYSGQVNLGDIPKGESRTAKFTLITGCSGRSIEDLKVFIDTDNRGSAQKQVEVDMEIPAFFVKARPTLTGYDKADQIPICLLAHNAGTNTLKNMEAVIEVNAPRETLTLEYYGTFDLVAGEIKHEEFHVPARYVIGKDVITSAYLREDGKQVQSSKNPIQYSEP